MKNFSLLLLLAILSAIVFTSCKEIESPAAEMGEVKFTLSGPDFQNTGRPDARVEDSPATSDWKHIYADVAELIITNLVDGTEITQEYNPNDSSAFNIPLPFGSYSFKSNVVGGVFEDFLPYALEGEFRLSSGTMDISLEATTDYGLVTVKNKFVTAANISAPEVDSKALTLLDDNTFRYVYVKKGTVATLQIRESYEGTWIEKIITVSTYFQYNFVLKIGEGVANIIDLIMAPFVLVENETIIGGAVIEEAVFFATDLGTIKCPEAAVGDKGTVDGKEYEAVDRALLITRRNEEADLTCVCTSLVTDMSDMFQAYFDPGSGPESVKNPFNEDIGNWDVSNVTNMSSMFQQSKFNQPIENWDVSNVTNMSFMFSQSDFNQAIENWDVSNVTSMDYMFTFSVFNQAIGSWDVSKVTNMERMFNYATGFDQPIGNWDVSKVINMLEMFRDSKFNQDISSWCVSYFSSQPGNFSVDSPLTLENKPKWGEEC